MVCDSLRAYCRYKRIALDRGRQISVSLRLFDDPLRFVVSQSPTALRVPILIGADSPLSALLPSEVSNAVSETSPGVVANRQS